MRIDRRLLHALAPAMLLCALAGCGGGGSTAGGSTVTTEAPPAEVPPAVLPPAVLPPAETPPTEAPPAVTPPSVFPRFAISANLFDGTISIMTVDAATGQLRHRSYVAGGATDTGRGPVSVAADPTGRFVYVANNASNELQAYRIDSGTGVLTQIDADAGTPGTQNYRLGTNPDCVTADPSGQFVYV